MSAKLGNASEVSAHEVQVQVRSVLATVFPTVAFSVHLCCGVIEEKQTTVLVALGR